MGMGFDIGVPRTRDLLSRDSVKMRYGDEIMMSIGHVTMVTGE